MKRNKIKSNLSILNDVLKVCERIRQYREPSALIKQKQSEGNVHRIVATKLWWDENEKYSQKIKLYDTFTNKVETIYGIM